MKSELIYFPDNQPNTWWHYSKGTNGVSAKLRGLSTSGEWTTHRSANTIDKVEQLLKKSDGEREPADPVSISHSEFWKQTLFEKNTLLELGNADGTETQQETRILTYFKQGLTKVRAKVGVGETPNLAPVIDDWSKKLAKCIKDKDKEINHFDYDDATKKARSDTGEGWQSYLLEACRHSCNGELPREKGHEIKCYSATRESHRNVFFAAQEVNLTIPKDKNPFVRGREGRIKPDGLGVDKDGGLVIFEIKGPQDVLDPLCATTQGILGAIAAHVKLENLADQLTTPAHKKSLRPPRHVALDAKLTVYIMISRAPIFGQRAPALTKEYDSMIRTLIAATPCLAEVSLFRISKKIRDRFTADGLSNQRPWLPTLTASNTWIRARNGEVTMRK